jgi:hypothetical protein
VEIQLLYRASTSMPSIFGLASLGIGILLVIKCANLPVMGNQNDVLVFCSFCTFKVVFALSTAYFLTGEKSIRKGQPLPHRATPQHWRIARRLFMA